MQAVSLLNLFLPCVAVFAHHPTAGAGYEPYESYDDYCGSEDGDDYEEELAAAAAHNSQGTFAQQGAAYSEPAAGVLQAVPAAATAVPALSAQPLTGKLSSNSSSRSLGGALQANGLQGGSHSSGDGTESKLLNQPSALQQSEAAAGGGGNAWSIAAGCDAEDSADCVSGSDNGCSCCSSGSVDLETDGEQQLDEDSAAAAAAAWLGEPPPAAWLAGAGSYRLALHTSSKHGAGTRTRVSR